MGNSHWLNQDQNEAVLLLACYLGRVFDTVEMVANSATGLAPKADYRSIRTGASVNKGMFHDQSKRDELIARAKTAQVACQYAASRKQEVPSP